MLNIHRHGCACEGCGGTCKIHPSGRVFHQRLISFWRSSILDWLPRTLVFLTAGSSTPYYKLVVAVFVVDFRGRYQMTVRFSLTMCSCIHCSLLLRTFFGLVPASLQPPPPTPASNTHPQLGLGPSCAVGPQLPQAAGGCCPAANVPSTTRLIRYTQ